MLHNLKKPLVAVWGTATVVLVFLSCFQPYHFVNLDDADGIISFAFLSTDNEALSTDHRGLIDGSTIHVQFPRGTDVSNLVPSIEVHAAGGTLDPSSREAIDLREFDGYSYTRAAVLREYTISFEFVDYYVSAHYLMNTEVTRIAPHDLTAEDPLPPTLVIEPGEYSFLGQRFLLHEEGLYRFIAPPHASEQRIVYRENTDALLSGLSWIASHGNRDNSLPATSLIAKAMQEKIVVTCGIISRVARSVLLDHGVDSRIVATLTLDDWNSYDNGHTMLEVFHPREGRWLLYDLDTNRYFVDPDTQNVLNLIEFVDRVADRDYEMVSISSSIEGAIGHFTSGDKYSYDFFSETMFADVETWYERVVQVMLIEDDTTGTYRFFDDVNRHRVKLYSPNYVFLDHDQFMTRFYAE